MRQQDVFRKVGGILQELNEQYDYLKTQSDDLNDLELELFAANVNFLADHLEILRKLNVQSSKHPQSQNTQPDNLQQATVSADIPFVNSASETPVTDSDLKQPDEEKIPTAYAEEANPQAATDIDQPDNTFQYEFNAVPEVTEQEHPQEQESPVLDFQEPEQHGASFEPNDLELDTISDYQEHQEPEPVHPVAENYQEQQDDFQQQEESKPEVTFPTFKLPETEFNFHTTEPQQPEYQNPVEQHQEPGYNVSSFEQQQPEQQLPEVQPEQAVYVEPVYPHDEPAQEEQPEQNTFTNYTEPTVYRQETEEGSSGINLDSDTGQDTFSFTRQEEPAVERASFNLNEADTWKSNEEQPAATFVQPEVKPEPAPEAPPAPAAYTPEPTSEPAPAPATPKFVSHTAYPPPPEPAKEPERPLTLNERISAQLGQHSSGTAALSAQPIKDLKSAVTLNDKMLFVRDLFNGYSLAYSEAIEILNRFNNFDDASRFLQVNYVAKNNWAAKQATADKFYDLLRRRFA